LGQEEERGDAEVATPQRPVLFVRASADCRCDRPALIDKTHTVCADQPLPPAAAVPAAPPPSHPISGVDKWTKAVSSGVEASPPAKLVPSKWLEGMGLSDHANGLRPETLSAVYQLQAPIASLRMTAPLMLTRMGIEREQARLLCRVLAGGSPLSGRLPSRMSPPAAKGWRLSWSGWELTPTSGATYDW
jgi:hypothetical protein